MRPLQDRAFVKTRNRRRWRSHTTELRCQGLIRALGNRPWSQKAMAFLLSDRSSGVTIDKHADRTPLG